MPLLDILCKFQTPLTHNFFCPEYSLPEDKKTSSTQQTSPTQWTEIQLNKPT